MKKNIIGDRPAAPLVQSLQPQDLSSTSATAQLQQAIEQEKARRVSRSRPLEVVQYEPGLSDQARHLVEGWHLLFFARAGNEHMQELRAALQQENARDLHLLSCVQRVKAQYREHMAKSVQSHRESVQEQAVIAEIRYGGLSLIPAFWLPEDMEMGLSLLPRTGAQLPIDALTLVEHAQPAATGSLDVLLVAATESRTRAELATEHLVPADFLSLHNHAFAFSTFVTLADIAVAAEQAANADANATAFVAANAAAFVAAIAAAYGPGGYDTSTDPLAEGRMHNGSKMAIDLKDAPSVSQLLSARERLLSGKMS